RGNKVWAEKGRKMSHC
ncbi:unnamed protein product, partial [Cuscuta campestris]